MGLHPALWGQAQENCPFLVRCNILQPVDFLARPLFRPIFSNHMMDGQRQSDLNGHFGRHSSSARPPGMVPACTQ